MQQKLKIIVLGSFSEDSFLPRSPNVSRSNRNQSQCGTLTFIHSSRVTVDFITFDKSFAGNQKLVTQFRNIERVSFQGLHVDEAIEVNKKIFFLKQIELKYYV